MKVCRVCKEEKNMLSFSKDKRAKDGCQSECRQCRASRYAKQKQYINDSVEVIKNDIKWYKYAEVIVLPLIFSYLVYLVLQ